MSQIRKRRPDDITVEQFSIPAIPLSIIAPSDALAAYPGPKEGAEKAFVAIFELANKGPPHLATGVLSGQFTDRQVMV